MSVAIATYNARTHLSDAVASALKQSLHNIEVILVDDCSRDGTWELALALASSDKRIIVDRLASNGGPAAARNRALTLARGDWFAVLDSDDLFLPGRLEHLVMVGEELGADIVVDDLVVFEDGHPDEAAFFLGSETPSQWIELTDYLQRTVMYAAKANLGYLKPLIRIDRLRAHELSYDEQLRVAEDDDLLLRMLAAGMRYYLDTRAGYAYRRHSASTSHRLSAENALAILNASERLITQLQDRSPKINYLLQARHTAFIHSEAFARFIESLKARQMGTALKVLLENPAVLPMLKMPLAAAFRRLFKIPPNGFAPRTSPAAATSVATAMSVSRGSS